MKYFIAVVTVVLAACVTTSSAQDTEQAAAKSKRARSGELFDTIARMDRAVFDAHDLERLMGMFTADLELFDDGNNGGCKSYAQVKEDFGKVFTNVPDLHRELVQGTLEVYPLKGYGAIEVGEHRFCHDEHGKQDCGITKFTMVWRQVGDTWKLSRVVSYSH